MNARRPLSLMLAALSLAGALACGASVCGLSVGDPAEVVAPAAATAGAAAQSAGQVAQTAAAQAGELSGTAVALATREGSEAVATARALATPFADFLEARLNEIEPDADGAYRFSLSESEVNTLLRLRQLVSGDLAGAALQSQEVRFRDGLITLSGRLLEPLPGELQVRLRPAVDAGRLALEVVEASVAGRQAPAEAQEAAVAALNGALGEALQHLPAGLELEAVTAEAGELTFVSRRVEGN